jgi:CheY-like chemotaxis protein
VTSEAGLGSQFSCIIPFSLQIQASANYVMEPEPVYRTRPAENRLISALDREMAQFDMSVLVVEDNLINQKISKIMLEQVGCRVDIACSGQDALEKLKKRYDMIFMDIGLPDMDGFEAVSHIRRREDPGSHTPIVAMTAHVFEHDRERCFNVGMDEVMAKPIMQDDLVKVLKRWAA